MCMLKNACYARRIKMHANKVTKNTFSDSEVEFLGYKYKYAMETFYTKCCGGSCHILLLSDLHLETLFIHRDQLKACFNRPDKHSLR